MITNTSQLLHSKQMKQMFWLVFVDSKVNYRNIRIVESTYVF